MTKQITKAIANYHAAIAPAAVKAALTALKERGLPSTAADVRRSHALGLADDIYADAAKVPQNDAATALAKVTRSAEMTSIGKAVKANRGGILDKFAGAKLPKSK